MIPMVIKFVEREGEAVWPEIADKPLHHLGNGAPPIQLAVLDFGMTSGRPSMAIRLDLPDGSHVIAETSARLFAIAARLIMAKYPKLEDG
jgi:hypothetical protein